MIFGPYVHFHMSAHRPPQQSHTKTYKYHTHTCKEHKVLHSKALTVYIAFKVMFRRLPTKMEKEALVGITNAKSMSYSFAVFLLSTLFSACRFPRTMTSLLSP